jgi:hypothetical protein
MLPSEMRDYVSNSIVEMWQHPVGEIGNAIDCPTILSPIRSGSDIDNNMVETLSLFTLLSL